MALIQWSEDLRVGDSRIDSQHIQWIELINRLHQAMLEGKGAAALQPTFDAMTAYARTHFGDEQRLMEATSYPDRLRHKQLHKQFVEQLGSMQAKLQKGGSAGAIELMNALRSWLLQHIKHEDAKLGAHLAEGV